jgi:hypothetical protein
MRITKLPSPFALLTAASLLLTSCASQPARSARLTSNHSTLPVSWDDRYYDIHAHGWDTPPPYARFGEGLPPKILNVGSDDRPLLLVDEVHLP